MSSVFYSYNKQKRKIQIRSTEHTLLFTHPSPNVQPEPPLTIPVFYPTPPPPFYQRLQKLCKFCKNPRRCLLSFIAITNKKEKFKYVQQSTPFCLLPLPKLFSTNLPSPSQFSIPLPAPILPTFAEALQILQKP